MLSITIFRMKIWVLLGTQSQTRKEIVYERDEKVPKGSFGCILCSITFFLLMG
jgi:hypothetical protein